MGDLSALLSRPIAHRGLHQAAGGLIENSLGAARAAIAAGYAIECDVQITQDGAAVVFHDDDLSRLTDSTGCVRDLSLAALQCLRLRGATETIPSLNGLLATIDERVPLVIELKSAFDGDLRLLQAVAIALKSYRGAVFIESFDPLFIARLRIDAARLGLAHVSLGIVGQANYPEHEWPQLSPCQRRDMTHFLHYPQTRPDFVSWNVADLPHAVPFLARQELRLPVTTWTIRTPEQARQARQWTDQIVFEGFAPA
jgi:glycerophosphoryl diester phosphodiesterase